MSQFALHDPGPWSYFFLNKMFKPISSRVIKSLIICYSWPHNELRWMAKIRVAEICVHQSRANYSGAKFSVTCIVIIKTHKHLSKHSMALTIQALSSIRCPKYFFFNCKIWYIFVLLFQNVQTWIKLVGSHSGWQEEETTRWSE